VSFVVKKSPTLLVVEHGRIHRVCTGSRLPDATVADARLGGLHHEAHEAHEGKRTVNLSPYL